MEIQLHENVIIQSSPHISRWRMLLALIPAVGHINVIVPKQITEFNVSCIQSLDWIV